MKRQINLYEARLRPRFEWATARHLACAVVLLCVLLAALVVSVQQEAKSMASALSAVQTELQLAQAQLATVSEQATERAVSPTLTAELRQTRTLLETRQEVVAALSGNKIGNHTGFADYMFSFARQANPDVWLTGFTLTAGGEELELRGRLLDPTKLPDYVQRLGDEPLLRGRQFAMLDIRGAAPEAKKASPEGAAQTNAEAPLVQLMPKAMPVSASPRFIEFVLRSANAGNSADSNPLAGLEAKKP
jgi:hypothetical protein